jgi:O-methyltransferase
MDYVRTWRSNGPLHLLKNTPGLTDVYEFGVFNGNSTAELSMICSQNGIACDHLVGFDSFDGIPKELAEPVQPFWDPDQSSYYGAYNAQLFFNVNTPEEAMNKVYNNIRPLVASHRRLTLVPGFYEQSLTDDLPITLGLKKAIIVDIDCDIYSAAKTALQWLFRHKLVDVGTYLFYDDWGGTPGYTRW